MSGHQSQIYLQEFEYNKSQRDTENYSSPVSGSSREIRLTESEIYNRSIGLRAAGNVALFQVNRQTSHVKKIRLRCLMPGIVENNQSLFFVRVTL